MQNISFTLSFPDHKSLTFSTCTHGLLINRHEYLSGKGGTLIYTQVKGLTANSATCQLSTNTSTLIPALKVLSLPYHPYFDRPEVIASQNDIAFYWHPSRLAAFYNRFSTDQLDYPQREPLIRKAVTFLLKSASQPTSFLPQETLAKLKEPVKLLGFYQGFPIFDNKFGLAKLVSRLGIHVDQNEIMISTPLPEHASEVEKLARSLEAKLKLAATYKHNRAVFPASPTLLSELGLK